jgi:hypothetical protein
VTFESALDCFLPPARDKAGHAAIRTVKRWVVLPIADLAWRVHRVVGRNALAQKGGVPAALLRRRHETEVAMTLGALRVSAVVFSAAAFVLSSPLSAADAATIAHHYRHAAHPRVSHGLHGYVAHGHAGHGHYVWRNGHRYVYGYGYNPGAAVAAGVIAGTAAGYPYCDDYYSGSYYG